MLDNYMHVDAFTCNPESYGEFASIEQMESNSYTMISCCVHTSKT